MLRLICQITSGIECVRMRACMYDTHTNVHMYVHMHVCRYLWRVYVCHAMPCHVMSSKVMCFTVKECQVKYAYSVME